MVIESREAQLLSKILYKIYSIQDNLEMRKTFLELIPNLVMCRRATFYLDSGENQHVLSSPVGYHMDDDLLNRYLDYEQYDYMNCIFTNSETEVYRETDYFIDAVRSDSPYYTDLLVPNDMYYSVQVSLYFSKTFLGVFTLFRGKNDSDFSDHDIFLLRLIKDHLSLRLHMDYDISTQKVSLSDISRYVNLYDLTLREGEVLQLLFKGLSNDELAEHLNISHHTVQKHISNIYKKLNISSKSQLLKLYTDQSL